MISEFGKESTVQREAMLRDSASTLNLMQLLRNPPQRYGWDKFVGAVVKGRLGAGGVQPPPLTGPVAERSRRFKSHWLQDILRSQVACLGFTVCEIAMLPSVARSLTTSSSSTIRSRENRNKEVALYHAELIQSRKDVEARILASTEALLDLPSSSVADPAHPSLQEGFLVKNLLKEFQPSDYDSLIAERNINNSCGYVLCPRPKRQEYTKARYRILRTDGKGSDALEIVEKQSLETWCSDDCGKRALYLKVQLNQEPAWTRAATSSGEVVLLGNEDIDLQLPNSEEALTMRLEKLDINPEEHMLENMKALAIERGDDDSLCHVDVKISDKSPSQPYHPPQHDESRNFYRVIEGYNPRSGNSLAEEELSTDSQDVMHTI